MLWHCSLGDRIGRSSSIVKNLASAIHKGSSSRYLWGTRPNLESSSEKQADFKQKPKVVYRDNITNKCKQLYIHHFTEMSGTKTSIRTFPLHCISEWVFLVLKMKNSETQLNPVFPQHMTNLKQSGISTNHNLIFSFSYCDKHSISYQRCTISIKYLAQK